MVVPSWFCKVYRCVMPTAHHSIITTFGGKTILAFRRIVLFIAVSQIGTEGAGRVLLTYVVEQLILAALVGAAIGLAGGWLLSQARRREWMAASVQQLGLVTLPILSILACEPVGGSMFIAAYVAGIAVQVGCRDASALSVEFIDGWGQLFVYFVFFFFGLLVALACTRFSL